MKKILCIIMVIISLLIVNVKADDTFKCKDEEMKRLKELSKKLEYITDYKMDKDNALNFSITVNNLNEDLKVVIIDELDESNNKEFKYNDSKKATLTGFREGQKVTITIKGYVVNWCSGKEVATKTIRLPYYNYYYEEEKCNKYPDFKYCNKILESKISEQEYNNAFKRYLKEKEGEKEEPTVGKDKSNWNLLIIIGSIVGTLIIVVLVSVIVMKKRRKNAL